MPASWRCWVRPTRAIGCDRLVENRAVAVQAAQLNVIADQLRDQRQASISRSRRMPAALASPAATWLADSVTTGRVRS